VKEAYLSEAGTPRGKTPAVKPRNTPAKVKAGSKAKHVSVKNQKEALHPDIEQILLGQSQAHSLPLITALCNDLMTASTHRYGLINAVCACFFFFVICRLI
jgi:hypothetical protein